MARAVQFLFGHGREKEVRTLILQHLDKVGEVVARTREVLDDYLAGRLDAAKAGAINVDALETDADRMRRSVSDLLYRGAFLPIFRSDIHEFVEQLDRIADRAEETCDFLLGQRPELPVEFAEHLRQIPIRTQEAFSALHDAVTTFFSTGDERVIREKLKVVGVTESDIDDMEWKLTREVFTSNLPLASKIHINQFIETLTEISDQIEDTGDRLELLHIGTGL
jgi:predicted phosphate transport protein (TIGR00153 family)